MRNIPVSEYRSIPSDVNVDQYAVPNTIYLAS